MKTRPFFWVVTDRLRCDLPFRKGPYTTEGEARYVASGLLGAMVVPGSLRAPPPPNSDKVLRR